MSQIIADLQLHSKYSRAVSPKMDLFEIARWCSKKGIHLVATGDWQHPLWFREITTHLKEERNGIYRLKNPPKSAKNPVNFLLSTEISSIYSQAGQVRRVHNLIFSPSIKTAEKIIRALQKRGANLMADGRPIVGISSKDLLEMVLTIDENVLFIPAHAWTPWFALYGSKSGFDSITEAFEELAKHIYAIETGLSSDPLMNWQIKELETRSIVSFSDAHSGPKLGREATVFIQTSPGKQETANSYTYQDIANAIKQEPDSKLKIGYTIEFFPEEGKYHWSGHRVCNIRYTANDIKEKGTICPSCNKPLTVGVEERVNKLASKTLTENDVLQIKNLAGVTFVGDKEKKRRPYVSLIPLLEILHEVHKGSPSKALAQYEQLTNEFATEFDILLKKSYEEIEKIGGQTLATAIKIVRDRKVFINPGYDGVFGTVKIFQDENTSKTLESKPEQKQPALF